MRTTIEITGPSYRHLAAVALCAVITADGDEDLTVEIALPQLRYFCERLVDRMDEQLHAATLDDLQDALTGVERLRERLADEIAQAVAETVVDDGAADMVHEHHRARERFDAWPRP